MSKLSKESICLINNLDEEGNMLLDEIRHLRSALRIAAEEVEQDLYESTGLPTVGKDEWIASTVNRWISQATDE